MATYLSLQEDVQAILIDSPSAVTSRIARLVNWGKKRCQQLYNFEVMKAELAANTTLATRNLVAVPSDFKEYRDKPYFLRADGTKGKMEIATNRERLLFDYGNTDLSYPQYILRAEPTNVAGATFWEAWPLPDGNSDYTAAPAGEYRVKIPYWKFLPDFAVNGDTDWIAENAEWAIIYYACAKGFELDWDVEKNAEYIAKGKAELEEVKRIDKTLKLSQTDTFIPHHRGARASGQPR